MKVYLPANLDIDNHLQQFIPVNINNFEADKLIYLLSLLLSVPANNKRLFKTEDHWVPLYSKLLKKMVGNDYIKYINYALGNSYPTDPDAKIIDTDNRYIPGRESKGYSFVKRYRSHKQLKEITLTNNALLRRLRNAQFKRTQLVGSLYPNLVKWFNPTKLKIDAPRAYEYAQKLVEWESKKSGDFLIYTLFQKNSAGSYKEFKELDEQPDHDKQRSSYLVNIARIENGDFFLTVDNNVRRFHSNLTNIKSELRHFLTYDNQQLVSIDITNSQPFLSLSLFNQQFLFIPPSTSGTDVEVETSDNELTPADEGQEFILEEDLQTTRREADRFHISKVAPKLYTELRTMLARLFVGSDDNRSESEIPYSTPSLTTPHISSSPLMFPEYGNNHSFTDIVQFKDSVIRGTFYEDFLEMLREEGITEISTRAEAKIAIYLVLFTDNRFINSEEAAPKRMFQRVYPNVYDYFSKFKKVDKTRLARLLQSIESWLILDQVCEKISIERPEVPIFTIHDSVVTTVQNQDYVTSVMEQVISSYIGYIPVLKPTVYDPDDLPTTYEEYLNN